MSSTVKSAMMGNEDFAMSDLLTSKDDLQLASRSFKFGLVPKVTLSSGQVGFSSGLLYWFGLGQLGAHGERGS